MQNTNGIQIHKCPNPGPFTVENRGDGWYIYDGDSHSPKSCRFCYRCGAKLEDADSCSELTHKYSQG